MRKPLFNSPFLEAALVTVLIVSTLVFVTWQLASAPVAPEVEDLRRNEVFLASEVERLKQHLDRARAREAVLEREADVLRQANRLLREQESERMGQLNTLQSEVEFYRRLAGTGGAQSGLDIYRAEVLPTGSARVFQFMLTLTQNIRRAAIISGRARIDIEGTLEDRPVTLPWSDLSEGGQAEPSFRFKYFQQIDGYLTLPEGFQPIRMVVTLEAKDSRTPVQRSYGWNSLLAEPAD